MLHRRARPRPLFPRSRLPDPAASYARVMRTKPVPSENEGAGKAGCPLHPQPRVQVIKAHERSHYRFTGNTRPSLRNGFNGFLRALPGDRALLSPSPAEYLPPTWHQRRGVRTTRLRRPQKHRPSAQGLRSMLCVHRIPHPTFVTIAKRPSGRCWT
jgi:hypothetical protein